MGKPVPPFRDVRVSLTGKKAISRQGTVIATVDSLGQHVESISHPDVFAYPPKGPIGWKVANMRLFSPDEALEWMAKNPETEEERRQHRSRYHY